MKLADLWVKLGLKDEGFKKGVDNVKKKTNNLKGIFQKLHSKIKQTFSSKSTSKFASSMKKIGGVIAGAFAVGTIINFGKQLMQLGGEAQGIEEAFARIGDGKLLDGLRSSVKGTVSDLELMRSAVKAENFGIPVENLGNLLEFAAKRAQDTGESVDYLVDSIVTGIGRKSPLILDNLGITTVQLNEKLAAVGGIAQASSGQLAAAVSEIAGESMKQTGGLTENLGTKMQQLSAEWLNLQKIIFDKVAPAFTKIVSLLQQVAKWAVDNKDAIFLFLNQVLRFAGIFAVATGALKLYTLATTVDTKVTAVFKRGWKGLNTAMKANIFIAVISALISLAFYIKDLWERSEKFRAITKFVAASVASFFQKAWINIKKGAELMWIGIKTYFTAIPKLAKTIWNTIKRVMKGENIGDAFKDEMSAAFKDVQKDVKKVKDKYNKELEQIKTPNYEEILDAEKAKEEGKKAGDKAKEGFEYGVNTGQSATIPVKPRFDYKLGSGKMKSKEVEGVTMSDGVEMPSMDLADMTGDIARKNEQLKQLLAEQLQVWNDFKDRMSETMEAFAEDVVSGFAESMGEMIAAGNIDPGELGKQLLGQIGDLLSSLGKMLITFGIGSEAFQSLLATGMTNPVSAGLAIAAGAALVALGGAISSRAKSSASGGGSTSAASGGGGSTSRTSSVGDAAENMTFNIDLSGVLRGNDIKLSADRTNYKKNAIG